VVNLAERVRALFPEASGRSRKHWLEHGRVEVNGRVVRDGTAPIAPGDRVTLGRHGAVPFPPALGLVHEDEHLVVVDKPAGLLTVATGRERNRTAYRLLWDYLHAQRPPRRPFIVHRLDRETSGLLVFAKSVAAKRHLQTQFEARQVERIYLAVVDGRVTDDEGTLESRLVEDRGLRVRSGARGRQAITHYRVRERRRDSTLLELRLGTGRRHQIRVQLAEQGHPIVGDTAHGGPGGRFGRVCLHATRLGFVHPKSGAPMRFERRAPGAWV
jgi:23S rRNA pseudouridine1911/1915/1917 synthase